MDLLSGSLTHNGLQLGGGGVAEPLDAGEMLQQGQSFDPADPGELLDQSQDQRVQELGRTPPPERVLPALPMNDLSDELRGLGLPADRQQSQAEVKHHKLLHSWEVLLTEPGVLHQDHLLETTAAIPVANQPPLVAVSCYDVALGHVEDAAPVGQVEVRLTQLRLKEDLHTSTF